jgi:hypothetical protein
MHLDVIKHQEFWNECPLIKAVKIYTDEAFRKFEWIHFSFTFGTFGPDWDLKQKRVVKKLYYLWYLKVCKTWTGSYLDALNSMSNPSKALIPIATGKLAWILSTFIIFIKIFSKLRIKSSDVIDEVSFCCGKEKR